MYACMFNTESKPHPIHTIPVLTLTSRYTRKVPVILNHTRSTLPMIPTSFRTHPAAKLVLKHGKASHPSFNVNSSQVSHFPDREAQTARPRITTTAKALGGKLYQANTPYYAGRGRIRLPDESAGARYMQPVLGKPIRPIRVVLIPCLK
jgi:hypothetical protein